MVHQLSRPATGAPTDHSLLSWAYDPACAINSSAPSVAGTLQGVRIAVPYAMTITNVALFVVAADAPLTTG